MFFRLSALHALVESAMFKDSTLVAALSARGFLVRFNISLKWKTPVFPC